jgi:dephospho-CoA kinase
MSATLGNVGRRKLVIGLVGGIGSGKSFVAKLLGKRGGMVIDGDLVGHEALRQPAIRDRVVAEFGPGILGDDGEIVRRRVAEKVFRDRDALRRLETIVHPWIGQEIASRVEAALVNPAVRFVVLDAAVMLEAGWNNVCDRIVYVDASPEIRYARLAARGWTREQIDARERSQWPVAEKARFADVRLDNNCLETDVTKQLDIWLLHWLLTHVDARSSCD